MKVISPSLYCSIALLLVLGSCKNNTKPSTAVSTETLTALSGIYRISQVDSVEALYSTACASCHGQDGRGTEGGSPLRGSVFQSRWQDKSIGALFDVTKKTMPKTNPTSYDDKTYAGLIAFILRINNFPPAQTALSSHKEDLDKILLGPPAAKNVPYKFKPRSLGEAVTSY